MQRNPLLSSARAPSSLPREYSALLLLLPLLIRFPFSFPSVSSFISRSSIVVASWFVGADQELILVTSHIHTLAGEGGLVYLSFSLLLDIMFFVRVFLLFLLICEGWLLVPSFSSLPPSRSLIFHSRASMWK